VAANNRNHKVIDLTLGLDSYKELLQGEGRLQVVPTLEQRVVQVCKAPRNQASAGGSATVINIGLFFREASAAGERLDGRSSHFALRLVLQLLSEKRLDLQDVTTKVRLGNVRLHSV
jgi:hypothetical protein